MRGLLASILLSGFLVASARAATVTYVLPAPGIICEHNAAAARGAALAVKGVVSAEAFQATHTVEVELIDAGVHLDDVIRAINAAGYTVGSPKRKEPERR